MTATIHSIEFSRIMRDVAALRSEAFEKLQEGLEILQCANLANLSARARNRAVKRLSEEVFWKYWQGEWVFEMSDEPGDEEASQIKGMGPCPSRSIKHGLMTWSPRDRESNC